jgi:response regulator NasT
MSAPSRPLRIIVAEDQRDTREHLQELLGRLGHHVVTAGNGGQLVELCRAAPPDLIVTDIKMPDLDGIEATAQVSAVKQTPVILVSAHHDAELLERAGADHIMGYLIKPVTSADVETAIAMAMRRFEQFQALRREVASLRQALEDRKVIERAKGILMRRLGAGEEEAYRRLRKLASDRNHKVVDLARTVLQAEEVFQQLEPGGGHPAPGCPGPDRGSHRAHPGGGSHSRGDPPRAACGLTPRCVTDGLAR